MLGGEGRSRDEAAFFIIQEFLKQFSGNGKGVIYKHDFIKAVLQNREMLAVLSPFYCKIGSASMAFRSLSLSHSSSLSKSSPSVRQRGTDRCCKSDIP